MLGAFIRDKFEQYNIKLSLEQWIILRVLHMEDGVPQNSLAMITERHKASLTRIIGTMERKNLVARYQIALQALRYARTIHQK